MAVREGPHAEGHSLQHRLGAGGRSAPQGARRPGRPRLQLQARRHDGAPDGCNRRAEPVHDRQRAALGERQQGAELRAGEPRRLRAVLRQRRLALLGHLHAARRAPAAAGREELHRLERAEPRPVPDAAGPRRPDGRAQLRRSRPCLHRRGARRLSGRARRRRPDRESRRSGRRFPDRVPRGLQQGRRPAPRRARLQPVHERPRARPTSPRRRPPTAPSRCATSTSSSAG